LNLTAAALLEGDKQPLTAALDAVSAGAPDSLVETLEPIPEGVDPDELQNSGFVLHTLQTALFHALTADSAEDAIVNAVNGGGDADTIGAVAGAVAGARFGASALPERWLDALSGEDELRELARSLDERKFSTAH
jgi:ADP-ribosyl-[dinitrogen reductase] hydrolase